MNRTAVRITSTVFGAVLLAGTASVAVADTQHGGGDVDVSVEIPEIGTPGVLAMSVSADSITLAENGSDNSARTFTGALPTVTVTDTRDADEIPAGAFWYVLGSVSDFTSGTDTIGAENLGWTPQLIDGGESGNVAEGDAVDPEIDGGEGLVNKELLAMAADSGEIAGEGSWTATADLTLKTPTDVEAGAYSATLTLSLFE